MLLLESLEVLHVHAGVEVVRARGEDVFAGARRFTRHRGIELGVEEHRAQAREQSVERFAGFEGNRAPARAAACAERSNASGEHASTNLRAVRLLYGPVLIQKQLGVSLDLVERRAIGVRGGGHNRLEDIAHLETVCVALVVEDVAAGDRGLRQMPHERLLAQRQIPKPVRVQLHDGGFSDAFEQIRSIGWR